MVRVIDDRRLLRLGHAPGDRTGAGTCDRQAAFILLLNGRAQFLLLTVVFLRHSEVVGRRLALGALLVVIGGALIGAYR